jgi:glyoxylase-like metal-dependent hydrolase (beta-lactamase superfamily II)
MADTQVLPDGVSVFERGWLSSNNILIQGRDQAALIDSGYATHSDQTVSLLKSALGGRPLDLLLNTHLHSDHCGGNAALQKTWSGVRTLIPPGQAEHVVHWDPVALTYLPTGQQCSRFDIHGLLEPGAEIQLGDSRWQIHGAPGHDPHSIVLFEPLSRTLISADALWESGFGIVFPELEGGSAFEEVARTLDVIESLRPHCVIPGHGRVFTAAGGGVDRALLAARSRLDNFMGDPVRHARHAAKVLLKFKLLELQQLPYGEMRRWALETPYFRLIHDRYFPGDLGSWLDSLVEELERAGAARRTGLLILNA